MSDLTKLTIKNGTKDKATIWITLGTPDPNSKIPAVENVNDLVFNPAVELTQTPSNPKQGSFELGGGDEVELSAPGTEAMNGNLSYEFAPTQCNPAVGVPPRDGATLAEFSLNGGQETLDVSCVAGINACWKCTMTGGEGWNAGPTQPTVTSIENKKFNENAGQPGVYPYGCDDCTASVAPPSCIIPGKDNGTPQSEAICNVQRPGFDSPGGGSVVYEFAGAM